MAKCQQLLQSEKNRNALLEEEIARRDQTRIPQELDVLPPRPAEATALQTGERSKNDDPAYVIKHMGRLVHDENGVGRFAGSTTGVHFVLSAEKECQRALNMSCGFPESCFSLFLIHLSTTNAPTTAEAPLTNSNWVSGCFTSPLAYYHGQADVFIKDWEAFCPVLVRDELLKDITNLIDVLHNPGFTETPHSATAMALLMILCINDLKNDQFGTSDNQNSSLRLYIPMASASIDEIAAKGDIKSLQTLVLFALYNQLTGDCLAMTRINGLIVNLAQSLGIHRHARRFKMKPGEIELRKRLWWYIYIFDRYVIKLPRSVNLQLSHEPKLSLSF